MKWIKIKTEINADGEGFYSSPMPCDGESVLLCRPNGEIELDTVLGDGDGLYLDSGNDIEMYVAWMPLPEPYKEETK